MTAAKMKNFARENRLRSYTRHRRRDELITYLRNNFRPVPASPPSPQEMDIFEQQKMCKFWSQVRDKHKEWYGWLVNDIPEPVEKKASRAFKATKNKIMGLYKNFEGKESEETEEPVEQNKASFNPIYHGGA